MEQQAPPFWSVPAALGPRIWTAPRRIRGWDALSADSSACVMVAVRTALPLRVSRSSMLRLDRLWDPIRNDPRF